MGRLKICPAFAGQRRDVNKCGVLTMATYMSAQLKTVDRLGKKEEKKGLTYIFI